MISSKQHVANVMLIKQEKPKQVRILKKPFISNKMEAFQIIASQHTFNERKYNSDRKIH